MLIAAKQNLSEVTVKQQKGFQMKGITAR